MPYFAIFFPWHSTFLFGLDGRKRSTLEILRHGILRENMADRQVKHNISSCEGFTVAEASEAFLSSEGAISLPLWCTAPQITSGCASPPANIEAHTIVLSSPFQSKR